jgi:hypothetical protein
MQGKKKGSIKKSDFPDIVDKKSQRNQPSVSGMRVADIISCVDLFIDT